MAGQRTDERESRDPATQQLLQRWEKDPTILSVADYQALLAMLQNEGDGLLAALVNGDFRVVHSQGAPPLSVDPLPSAAPPQRREAILDRIGHRTNVRRFTRIVAPVSAAAAVAAAAAVLVLALTAVFQSPAVIASPAEPAAVVVRFELADVQAQTVSLAGTFTDWSPVPLTRSAEGIWFVELELVPNGTYVYNFVIDNQVWIADPTARRRVQDDFGGEQSVLFL